MLLRYSLNLHTEAKAIETAVREVIDSGIMTGDVGGKSNTSEVGDATAKKVIEVLKRSS